VAHTVVFTPAAARNFRKLPAHVQKQITPVINALADNPRPSGIVKLKGVTNLYRVQSGNYRIVYEVQDATLLVLVVKIGDRRDVYR